CQFRKMRRAARSARPFRLLAHNAVFPLLSETYIADEIGVLQEHGFEIAFSRVAVGSTTMPTPRGSPLYESFLEGLEEFNPDLVLFHWATTPNDYLALLRERATPFGVRTHSFDLPVAEAGGFGPCCIGTWVHPNNVAKVEGSMALPTLIAVPGGVGPERRERTLLSIGAGLSKRGLPAVIQAMGLIDDASAEIIIGLTNGHESYADDVRALCESTPNAPAVLVDVPNEVARSRICMAGAVVYSSEPGQVIGQPRSVLEAALAATPLVLPDLDDLRELVDDAAHFYVRGDAESMYGALQEALSDPLPYDRRVSVARMVAERHASPAAFERWADSLWAAMSWWRQQNRTDRDAVAARAWRNGR
ncbi:MAG: hypothetical protein ABIQ39_12070, partial [Ilumatobacteraceae bacterium]